MGTIIFWIVVIAFVGYIYLRRKKKIPPLFSLNAKAGGLGKGTSVINEGNIVEEWSQIILGMGGKGEELLKSIAAKLQVPWAQISIEAVVASDPDIIILDASMGSAVTPIEELRQHPIWREIPAVKQNRVYAVDANLVNRPGPRIVQGLQEIARIIHPELFK